MQVYKMAPHGIVGISPFFLHFASALKALPGADSFRKYIVIQLDNTI